MRIFYTTELNRDCDPLHVLAFALFYSSNQILFLKDFMKAFKYDCLVSTISNTFFSNINPLAGCRFTPKLCPKQPKPNSPLNFTFCTQQSPSDRGKFPECRRRIYVKESPQTLKAICAYDYQQLTLS